MNKKTNPYTEYAEEESMNDQFQPLEAIETFLALFEKHGITYCHWKSNYHIRYALTGIEDVDVLVAEKDFPRFTAILAEQGFKQATSVTNKMQPGVFHFLGNDSATGTLINVHAYTRILTGDHFLKNWALPFEKMLLSDTLTEDGIKITGKSTELIVFVFRSMIKYTTLLDTYFSNRKKARVSSREELNWIMAGTSINESLAKLEQFFPEVPASDFQKAVELLSDESSLTSRILLGRRFKQHLKKYKRYGLVKQSFLTATAVTRMIVNRFFYKAKHMNFLTGGKTIALVGPQATGKSTLATALRSWLGQELKVQVIHAGKPPATWLTYLPNKFIPLFKFLLPDYSSVKIEKKAESEKQAKFPLAFIIRKVLIAHERLHLLRKTFRQSRNGKLIISDRYPSDIVGAIDSATFTQEAIDRETSALKRALMNWEKNLYQQICPPDLVLQLSVPVDIAVDRNRTRQKKGKQTTEYVQTRHSMLLTPEFHHCEVLQFSTDRDFDEMLIEIKQKMWARL